MILVVVMLPVLLGFASLVIDGASGYVRKVQVQNAADAIALAAAQEIPIDGSCGAGSACDAVLRSTAFWQKFAVPNGAPAGITALHRCTSASDQDWCFRTPYKGNGLVVQVRVEQDFPTILGGIVGISSLDPSAQAAAGGESIPGADQTIHHAATPATIVHHPATVGQKNAAFAASTSTSAVTITGGLKTFDTLQTNGCFGSTGTTGSFARELWVGKKGQCTIPTTFEPNAPLSSSPNGATKSSTTVTLTTSLADGFNGWSVGDSITVSGVGVAGYNGTFTVASVISTTKITYTAGSGTALAASGGGMVRNANKLFGACGSASFPCATPAAGSCDSTYVSPVDCGLDWPVDPVNVKNAIQAQCDAQGHNYTSDPTDDAAWLSSHPPGSYCYSVALNFSIQGTSASSPRTFNGYTFMAPSIAVSNGGNNSVFIAPSPASTSPAFFASGGLLSNGYCSSTGNNLAINQAITITGQVFDPCGTLTFNSGGQSFTGFLEAFKITLTGGTTTYFIGTGPGGTGTAAWDEVTDAGTAAWDEVVPGNPTLDCCSLDE